MFKTFKVNKNGKIEFTKDELYKLLNEVWNDGKENGTWTWMSPAPHYWTSSSITCGSLSSVSATSSGSVTIPANDTVVSTKTVTLELGEDSVGRKK